MATKIKRLADLMDLDREERLRQELQYLDILMAKAVSQGKFKDALDVFERAHRLLAVLR